MITEQTLALDLFFHVARFFCVFRVARVFHLARFLRVVRVTRVHKHGRHEHEKNSTRMENFDTRTSTEDFSHERTDTENLFDAEHNKLEIYLGPLVDLRK